jgi:excisionase family DNA binding protein
MDLLTVLELCKLLKVSKDFVYSLIYDRKIPFISLGGNNGKRVQYRFDRGRIMSWLEANTSEPTKHCSLEGILVRGQKL